jgi:LmbE family N-acetylglucosaminyl deacetylase
MAQEFIPSSAMLIVAHPDDIEFGMSSTTHYGSASNGVTHVTVMLS